jgi:hypothetical protein
MQTIFSDIIIFHSEYAERGAEPPGANLFQALLHHVFATGRLQRYVMLFFHFFLLYTIAKQLEKQNVLAL